MMIIRQNAVFIFKKLYYRHMALVTLYLQDYELHFQVKQDDSSNNHRICFRYEGVFCSTFTRFKTNIPSQTESLLHFLYMVFTLWIYCSNFLRKKLNCSEAALWSPLLRIIYTRKLCEEFLNPRKWIKVDSLQMRLQKFKDFKI